METKLHNLRTGLILLIIVIIILAMLPIFPVPRSWFLYIFLFLIYFSMANMWNLLAGYSGLISLCPSAFVGLAGYTLAVVSWMGLPYYIGMILGSIVTAIFAILVSLPVFRLKGIYFAVGTLILPEILRFIFLLWNPVGQAIVGKGAGYTVKGIADLSQWQIYWFALTTAIASVLVLQYILNSKLGRGLAAIRDDEITADYIGINVFKLKLVVFVISAFLTGFAGTVMYIYSGYIEPASAFSPQWLITIMLATVIGGVGTREGPFVGTIIVILFFFILSRYAEISLIIQGVILIVIMLVAPKGIMGFIHKSKFYQFLLQLTSTR